MTEEAARELLKQAHQREGMAWHRFFALLGHATDEAIRLAYNVYIAHVEASEKLEAALGIRRSNGKPTNR